MTAVIPSNFANAVAPFVPVGRQPVGQENEDLRGSTLKPLEESAASARGENRRSPDERPEQALEQPRSTAGRDTEADNDLRASQERQRQIEEQQVVRELSRRDREVRQHEQAHAAIGGRYAGAPRYDFERGPDGISYAVSGEVPIDTSRIPNDPEATLQKAQQIRRAAYAPAEPSDTDRRVAAEASRIEAQARAELRQEQLESTIEAREAASGETDGSDDDRSAGSLADLPGAERARDDQDREERVGNEGRAEREGNEARDDGPSADERARDQSDRADELGRIRRRNVDTYLQLIELSALGDQPLVGSRLNQQV